MPAIGSLGLQLFSFPHDAAHLITVCIIHASENVHPHTIEKTPVFDNHVKLWLPNLGKPLSSSPLLTGVWLLIFKWLLFM